MKNKVTWPVLLLSLLFCNMVSAGIVLPSVFSDNMVLQRNANVTIWGWAHPGEEVTLKTSWDNTEYKTKGSNQATWSIKLETPGAGGPYTITVKGYNEIKLSNVMLGEVWLCSGQSNMDWSANAGIDNAEAEIAKANYPNIRFFTVPKITAGSPQLNVPGTWEACTPETMKYFSAVGYFFAQHLHEELRNVPIGIINSSWGGTPAEVWIPEEAIVANPAVASAAAKLTPSQWGPTEPGRAYNAMIKPLAGFKLAGVLWYQGESNVGSDVYDKTLATLITSWRSQWQEDFPFYYVQIAPYDNGDDHFAGVIVRDAQRRVLQAVPKTGMVVVSDISPTDDIHPRNKKPVGVRLANIALVSQYGVAKGIVNSPFYRTFKAEKNKATITFDNAKGLYFKNNKSTMFELAGTDGVFHPADAKIINNAVVVTSNKVKSPLKARYAWKNTAQADLFNNAGLPASSFLTE